MKTVKRFKLGELVHKDGIFIKSETIKEQLTSDELYEMGWPGLGPVPYRTVDYAWYEVPVEESK